MVEKEKKYLKAPVTAELTEKKSRFIANITPVSSEDEAVAFVTSLRKKYCDARHNCYAYIVDGITRFSDDGEPSRTAGLPMTDVLTGAGLDNVCAVVTRYFGGILLGTGGLVRAYQGAVSLALEDAETYTLKLMTELSATCDYSDHGKIARYAETAGYQCGTPEFTQTVSLIIYLPPEDYEKAVTDITNLTGGRAILCRGNDVMR